MPSYKHVSKKANRRRRRRFESSFSFRLAKASYYAVFGFAKLGEIMAKAADQAAVAMGKLYQVSPRSFVFGVDPASKDGDDTAVAVVSQTGNISTVEGVITWKPFSDLDGDDLKERATRINARLESNVRNNGLLPRPDRLIPLDRERAEKSGYAVSEFMPPVGSFVEGSPRYYLHFRSVLWIKGRYAGSPDIETLYRNYGQLGQTPDEAWTHLPMIDTSTGTPTDRIDID